MADKEAITYIKYFSDSATEKSVVKYTNRNTSWRLWDERSEKDSAGFTDSKDKKWVGS